MNVSDKDVEIDHLKYTILMMNQKLEVFNDTALDCQNYKISWENAEKQRDDLN